MELKIEARNVELRRGWQDKIHEEKERLVRHYPNFVLHLRATVEATSHHKEGGFEIKLVASVPGDTVVVSRKGDNVRALLGDAFHVLTQQLKENLRKKRKGKKGADHHQEVNNYGIIKKLSPHESYGFIATLDEREIYFHENSLKDVEMDRLSEGDSVMYGETIGDKGPQASWVRTAK